MAASPHPRFVFSVHSRYYHDTFYSTERCNLDDIRHRKETHEPPARKTLCRHCSEQRGYEESFHGVAG